MSACTLISLINVGSTLTDFEKFHPPHLLERSEPIEEGILEAKTECYEKGKVKSPPFSRSFYDNF